MWQKKIDIVAKVDKSLLAGICPNEKKIVSCTIVKVLTTMYHGRLHE